MTGKLALYFSFLLFLSFCKKENSLDCFKSNGSEVTEIRHPGSFTRVDMNDKIDVTIFQGPEYKVEVIAGKNIIKNISTKISGEVLKIENNNKCNFVRGYKKHVRVNITLPYLYSVINNGVATLNVDGAFSQDSIRVQAESSGDIWLNGTYSHIKAHSNGNGDVYLSGTCKSLSVYINGTNFLKAENLKVSDYVFIETLSKGDCYLNAHDLKRLEYTIYYEGNIYYKGEPGTISGVLEPGCKGRVIRED